MCKYVRCIYCRSGDEETVKNQMYRQNLGEVIIPMMEKPFKINGVWIKHMERLMPGYLFVYSDHETDYTVLKRIDRVIRILSYGKGYENTYLSGDDLAYAIKLKEQEGAMQILKAVKEGDYIRIKDSIAAGKEVKVKKLNKRRHMIEVEFEFMGAMRNLWLGYEMITE